MIKIGKKIENLPKDLKSVFLQVTKWVDLTMGGGKQNNNQDIMPPAIKEEEDEDVVAEIAAKKNRERFAINKSYSIEVKKKIVKMKCEYCFTVVNHFYF